jgi:ribose 5-phosphate isomerase B
VKVGFGADERSALTDAVRAELVARGHELLSVGPVADDELEQAKRWAQVGREVGELVADGRTDTAVLFCWTGTGVSIAANKVRGVRAALCTDAATAEGARKWNDANVLVLPLSGLVAVGDVPAILDAWFTTAVDPHEVANIAALE